MRSCLSMCLKGANKLLYLHAPAIHKIQFPVSGRPIVSSIDCPTEKISLLLDIILQPHVLETKSYIRDTSDFLQKFSNIKLGLLTGYSQWMCTSTLNII